MSDSLQTSSGKGAQRRAPASRVKKKKVTEVEAAIETLSADSLVCRDLGHSWTYGGRDAVLMEQHGQVKSFKRLVICRNCTSRRWDPFSISPSGLERTARMRPQMDYADGYLNKTGVKVTRDDIRYVIYANATFVTDEDEKPPESMPMNG